MNKKTKKVEEPKVVVPTVTKPGEEVIPDVDISRASEAMEEAMMSLIHEMPFFANLALNCHREFTTRFPTLAVNVTDEVNLFINPYFFCAHTISERAAFILHEMEHVLNNHFVRFRDLEPQIYDDCKPRTIFDRLEDMMDASLLNQAADYAINEYNPNLPKKVKMYDKNGKALVVPLTLPNGSPNPDKNAGKVAEGNLLFVKDLKKRISHIKEQERLEYYYEFLKQEQEKNKKNGNGEGQGEGHGIVLDDHSAWAESEASEDAITDKIRDVVNKAVEQTGDRAMGNLPAAILQAIDSLNHQPRDWRSDLQRFAARATELLIESTRKRRNRRYGIIYPGQKVFPKLHIGVLIDCSGSVADEELNQFFAEIGRIHKLETKVTIIEHDSKVNRVYEYDPKKKPKVEGRGGTDFSEGYKEANKHDIDALFHFSDGECCDQGIKRPKFPVLACLVGGKTRTYPYGWATKTFIEVKKKVKY